MSNKDVTNRRDFFSTLLKGGMAALAGGVMWGAFVQEAKDAPLVLRPPGAVPADDFLAKCIRCGLCVEACPYDTLSLATPGSGVPAGTPKFTPRVMPCYLCQDIPCAVECPTSALDVSLVSSADGKNLDINRAQMGLAVMDYHNCIAAWGLRCDACYRACPLIDQAIILEYSRNERTGRHAILLPKVQTDACTGCGLCERACVVEESAIIVLPREVALGKVGDHYFRGWDKEDQKRIKNSIAPDDVRKDEATDPLDYLNDGGLDYE